MDHSEGIPTPVVAEATGLSYRQLDHWRRLEIIEPSIRTARGPGSRILWSRQDLAILSVVSDLRTVLGARTVPPFDVRLREVVDALRDWEPSDPNAVLLIDRGVPSVTKLWHLPWDRPIFTVVPLRPYSSPF
jgi:DNA-binding transcriptional MerR regulator